MNQLVPFQVLIPRGWVVALVAVVFLLQISQILNVKIFCNFNHLLFHVLVVSWSYHNKVWKLMTQFYVFEGNSKKKAKVKALVLGFYRPSTNCFAGVVVKGRADVKSNVLHQQDFNFLKFHFRNIARIANAVHVNLSLTPNVMVQVSVWFSFCPCPRPRPRPRENITDWAVLDIPHICHGRQGRCTHVNFFCPV